MTTLRYWAGARAAAGTSSEQVSASTLAEALDAVCASRGARFADVLAVCSFVVDGRPVGTRDHAAVDLTSVELVDVLPPFAGG